MGRHRKNRESFSWMPTTPSTATPNIKNPSQTTQNTRRAIRSVDEGKAALVSSWLAPALSESLSNFARRKAARTTILRKYANAQPRTAMTSIASRRGRKCAKSRASSCIARVNSPTISSHIFTSLPSVPPVKQVRLQTFECLAESFHVRFHLFPGSVAIFAEEGVHLSTIKRGHGLDDVIPADYGFVIRRRKFINCLYPQFVGISKVVFRDFGDVLYFEQSLGRED